MFFRAPLHPKANRFSCAVLPALSLPEPSGLWFPPVRGSWRLACHIAVIIDTKEILQVIDQHLHPDRKRQ
jgi:hypothetical protein